MQQNSDLGRDENNASNYSCVQMKILKTSLSYKNKPLLLRIERSQLRWYGHVTRMSHEQTAKQLMDALPSGKRPRGRPTTLWRNYIEDLA